MASSLPRPLGSTCIGEPLAKHNGHKHGAQEVEMVSIRTDPDATNEEAAKRSDQILQRERKCPTSE